MKVILTRTLKNIVKIKYDQGALMVVANCFISKSKLKHIIAEHSDWIASQKKSAQQELQFSVNSSKNDLADGRYAGTFNNDIDNTVIKDMFAGRKTMILGEIVCVAESVYSKTYLDGDTLYVSDKCCNKVDKLKAIKTYLKKIASLYLAGEISDFGSNISLCPVKIQFKDLSNAWLNCADAGQKILTMDYRVAQLPRELRTYIIAHAFAHFSNHAHDEHFDNYLSNVSPMYKDIERRLDNFDFLRDI